LAPDTKFLMWKVSLNFGWMKGTFQSGFFNALCKFKGKYFSVSNPSRVFQPLKGS